MRNHIVIAAIVVAFLAGFGWASALQEEPEKKEENPMAPPPPIQDEICDEMVGLWEWTGFMNMGEGQKVPTSSTEKIEWAINGQFLTSEYKSIGADGTVFYEALGVHRPNPEEKTTKLWWFDNYGGTYLYEGKREGNTEVSYADGGKEGKLRSTITRQEDGTLKHVMESQKPGQESWTVMFVQEGKKKAD